MPKTFRMRPRTDDKSKFFRPPSRIERDKKREERWSDEYKEANRIRSSGRWKRLRDSIIKCGLVCEFCSQIKSEQVHHIVPLVEDPSLAFDRRNLSCLCEKCHEIAHQRDKMKDPIRYKLQSKANEREDRYE